MAPKVAGRCLLGPLIWGEGSATEGGGREHIDRRRVARVVPPVPVWGTQKCRRVARVVVGNEGESEAAGWYPFKSRARGRDAPVGCGEGAGVSSGSRPTFLDHRNNEPDEGHMVEGFVGIYRGFVVYGDGFCHTLV